jgi:hypothetical protein
MQCVGVPRETSPQVQDGQPPVLVQALVTHAQLRAALRAKQTISLLRHARYQKQTRAFGLSVAAALPSLMLRLLQQTPAACLMQPRQQQCSTESALPADVAVELKDAAKHAAVFHPARTAV